MESVGCVVVMGVAASGKTTVAMALARRLGRAFLDADSLHSPENVAKMRRGVPLTDDDRRGWLIGVRDWIQEHHDSGERTVVACSALRRSYRDQLRMAGAPVWFCHLDLPEAELSARLDRRDGHFMPGSLLSSQLATLEPLQADEAGAVVDGIGTMDQVVARVVRTLAAATA